MEQVSRIMGEAIREFFSGDHSVSPKGSIQLCNLEKQSSDHMHAATALQKKSIHFTTAIPIALIASWFPVVAQPAEPLMVHFITRVLCKLNI